jgi:hypothetical protein
MNEDMALRKTLTVKNATEQKHCGNRAIEVNLKWEKLVKKSAAMRMYVGSIG